MHADHSTLPEETGLKIGQRSKAVVHAFARCSVGLAGLGGFVLAYGILVTAPAEVRAWVAVIAAVLVLASAASVWRPSLLPAIAAFSGGVLLLVLVVLIWWFSSWP